MPFATTGSDSLEAVGTFSTSCRSSSPRSLIHLKDAGGRVRDADTVMKRAAAILLLILVPLAVEAQTSSVLATKRPVTWGMIVALLFLMLGPIRLVRSFAAATRGCDHAFRLRLATRAFVYAVGAVTIAAALGKRMLDNFAIPVQVLQIAAGVILFLVALQAVMQQYSAARSPERSETPTMAMAFSPLAFPTIATPYGIAAVTILVTLAPTTGVAMTVAAAVYAILFLDWLAMLGAHVIERWLGSLLLLLGVVLGVNQVALGLQLMLGGISGLIEQGAFSPSLH